MSDAEVIRKMIDDFSHSIEARDLDAIEAAWADEIVVFDVPPPESFTGKAAYRKLWEDNLGMFEGDLTVDTRDLVVEAAGNIAYAHFLSRLRANFEGPWVRVTLGLKKTGDKWLVTHNHASLPFDFGMDGQGK